MPKQPPSAQNIIEQLRLDPHPEGGWFRETWRPDISQGDRASGTAIYYLLKRGERSHWHRIDAVEIWRSYAGAPLELSLSDDGAETRTVILGPDLAQGHAPQIILPAYCWQAAQSLGDWTLVGCTVSPAFQFKGFEMAPKDWRPGE